MRVKIFVLKIPNNACKNICVKKIKFVLNEKKTFVVNKYFRKQIFP